MDSLIGRFWAKVWKKDGGEGCWEWRAERSPAGYGRFWNGSVAVPAHRFAWTIARGTIPTGLCVLHTCDTPPCVNPAHLFLGTQQDNLRDMREKGRYRNRATGPSFPRALYT